MSNASFCLTCDKKPQCKAICPELEKTLPKMNTGRMGGKLSIIEPQRLEKIHQEALDHKSGKKKKTVIYDDNWEA